MLIYTVSKNNAVWNFCNNVFHC